MPFLRVQMRLLGRIARKWPKTEYALYSRISPKMAEHFYEPETYFAGQTPGLSSVFLAQQNVKIRIGIEL